jgi:putative nucleotidyltransferase with HDIG domain
MSEIHRRFLNAVERMPAFPKSVHQVLALTSNINCSQKQLVEVIRLDPVFTLKILKLVNSAFFGLAREVTSIHQASVYLGLNTLKNVALGLAAIGVFPRDNPAGLDMDAFWLHSLAVATATRMLGEQIGVPHDEVTDYFAGGLLHDVGKMVFALYMPGEFRQALDIAAREGRRLLDVEVQVFGVSHAELGAVLARKWNLPKNLAVCLADHHAPRAAEGQPLVDCCFAANQVVKRIGVGAAGDKVVEDLPEGVRQRFSTDVAGLVAALPDLPVEIDKARVFVRLGEDVA